MQTTSHKIQHLTKAGRGKGVLSADNEYIYAGDIVYQDNILISGFKLRGIVKEINFLGSPIVEWTDAYSTFYSEWCPLYVKDK